MVLKLQELHNQQYLQMEDNLLNIHEEIKLAYSNYIKESEKFEKENVKVSAARARKALIELGKLIPARRKEIQEKKVEI